MEMEIETYCAEETYDFGRKIAEKAPVLELMQIDDFYDQVNQGEDSLRQ